MTLARALGQSARFSCPRQLEGLDGGLVTAARARPDLGGALRAVGLRRWSSRPRPGLLRLSLHHAAASVRADRGEHDGAESGKHDWACWNKVKSTMYSPFIRLRLEDDFLENIEVPEASQCISRIHMNGFLHSHSNGSTSGMGDSQEVEQQRL
ncbi:unnamed protein product [Urochloa humidicola]